MLIEIQGPTLQLFGVLQEQQWTHLPLLYLQAHQNLHRLAHQLVNHHRFRLHQVAQLANHPHQAHRPQAQHRPQRLFLPQLVKVSQLRHQVRRVALLAFHLQLHLALAHRFLQARQDRLVHRRQDLSQKAHLSHPAPQFRHQDQLAPQLQHQALKARQRVHQHQLQPLLAHQAVLAHRRVNQARLAHPIAHQHPYHHQQAQAQVRHYHSHKYYES